MFRVGSPLIINSRLYHRINKLQFYNNLGLSFPNALVKSLIFFRICGLQKSCSLSSPLSLPNHSLTNTIFSEIWAPHGSCQNSTHISNYSNPLITNDLQWPQFNFANSIFLRVWAIQGPRRKFTNNLKIIQFYIYKQFRLQWSHSSHTYTHNHISKHLDTTFKSISKFSITLVK